MIGEPDDPKSVLLQGLGADAISGNPLVRAMLVTVQLNDKPRFKADKIDNVRSDGLLTAKLESGELTAPQSLPQFAFNIGLFAAKFPGEFVLHDPPSPAASLRNAAPSPTRGEGNQPPVPPNFTFHSATCSSLILAIRASGALIGWPGVSSSKACAIGASGNGITPPR